MIDQSHDENDPSSAIRVYVFRDYRTRLSDRKLEATSHRRTGDESTTAIPFILPASGNHRKKKKHCEDEQVHDALKHRGSAGSQRNHADKQRQR